MNKLPIVLLLCIVLMACDRRTNGSFTIMPSELDSILDRYIADNPNNKIYYLVFENRCNKQFFTLQSSSDCYDSRFMDGCFMKGGKIIVYWSVNKSWKDSLLHIQEGDQCRDSLTQYTDFAKTDMDYDAPYNPQTYRILSVSQYRKAEESDWAYPKPACDSNVINSSALNAIVNDYINTNDSPNIVYLRFSNLNGENFVSLGYDYVYDSESFSGMFYRDERVIVVYAIENLKDLEMIDKQSMLPIQAISDYKSQRRKFPRIPEKKYRIVSKEKVELISYDNRIWMDI